MSLFATQLRLSKIYFVAPKVSPFFPQGFRFAHKAFHLGDNCGDPVEGTFSRCADRRQTLWTYSSGNVTNLFCCSADEDGSSAGIYACVEAGSESPGFAATIVCYPLSFYSSLTPFLIKCHDRFQKVCKCLLQLQRLHQDPFPHLPKASAKPSQSSAAGPKQGSELAQF
jgi:hypothetical protein